MYKREDAEYENQHMRDAMLAHTVVVSVGWPSVCLSVCLSVSLTQVGVQQL